MVINFGYLTAEGIRYRMENHAGRGTGVNFWYSAFCDNARTDRFESKRKGVDEGRMRMRYENSGPLPLPGLTDCKNIAS